MSDSTPLTLDAFLQSLREADGSATFSYDYHFKHKKRFQETDRLLRTLTGTRAIEIGATDFFQVVLKQLGFDDIWGTVFSDNAELKLYNRQVIAADRSVISRTVSIDIEKELFPVNDGHFDLVLFCEVLEHLDIDPMFSLVEFNRILSLGGKILLTTPNCCSARNTWKILKGYRPHFFMQYERSRSPYRHNFEHDVHSVTRLLEGAGFSVDYLSTLDVFEEPVPEAVAFLKRNGLPTQHRGDDIFVVATKVGPVTDRWPLELYV
ncbi:MAG: methyltransferase domain-containing protein [Hyphomicrobiales bacterium]|nr:MAG: methyltransferase domain-containing protein [Hyphomicrobiales bacterium]